MTSNAPPSRTAIAHDPCCPCFAVGPRGREMRVALAPARAGSLLGTESWESRITPDILDPCRAAAAAVEDPPAKDRSRGRPENVDADNNRTLLVGAAVAKHGEESREICRLFLSVV